MTDTPQPRLHPLADTSPSAVVAGFIAMMTGYTSSLVLMFQAGQAAGLTSGQISSLKRKTSAFGIGTRSLPPPAACETAVCIFSANILQLLLSS